jgi:hypothetical protein
MTSSRLFSAPGESSFTQNQIRSNAGVESVNDRPGMYASDAAPLRRGHRLSFVRHHHVAAAIVLLIAACCPSAIFGAVSNAVVDPIECGSGWSLAHVGEKVGERHPAIADRNATAAVHVEFRVLRVKAPLFHSFPCVVDVGTRVFVRAAVAPARHSFPGREMVAPDFINIAALAAAIPVVALCVTVRKPNDNQTPKRLTSKVFHGEPPSKVIRIELGRAVMSRLFGSDPKPSQQS